uniref:DDE Tnp4 domain-containing protein n=1 Tax=Neolamprologus brichardi TaxID=32507 RepID=A0A3Q4HGW6_NEOBR
MTSPVHYCIYSVVTFTPVRYFYLYLESGLQLPESQPHTASRYMAGVPQLRSLCFLSGWPAEHPSVLLFAIPRSTVHRIVHRVTEEVVAILHQVIHLPRTPEDLDAMSHRFAGLARHIAFLKAAGAIDCCHVRIKNRKLFPSILQQAICDHQDRFISTYVGWSGSVHDSRVLHNSPLYWQAIYPPPVHFILTDGGYPCLQHPLPLITPYKRPVQGVGAQRFNSHHSRARSIIEHAFGMMKTRFHAIFLRALEVHHTFLIAACAVLHNICLGVGDIVAPGDEPKDDVQDEGETGLEAVSGALWQDQLFAEVSALEEVPLDHNCCEQAGIL